MSNPYLNNILFGNSKASVDEDYICSLGEFMLTEDWLQRMVKEPVNANSFELSSPELDCIPPASRPEYFSFDLRDSLRCAKEILSSESSNAYHFVSGVLRRSSIQTFRKRCPVVSHSLHITIKRTV